MPQFHASDLHDSRYSMNQFFRRLHYLLNRRRFDRELAEDMALHREMAARTEGWRFGNLLRLREEARDAWGWTWLDRCAQDLRYAARMLRRSPGFTLAAVLMLAIGIGVNVAAFSFLNVAFLKPLPVRDPHTLLRFERRAPDRYASDLPYPEVAFFRDYTRTLSAVLALHPDRLTIDAEAATVSAHFVTENFFSELGTPARLGRMFAPGRDAAPDAEPVAVLSHGFWQRHFGSDPLVVGKSISLNNRPVAVIGVASPEFGGLSLDDPDVWLPITRHAHFVKGSQLLSDFSADDSGVKMWGRMHAGVTPTAVEDDLRTLAATLRAQHPEDIWENERLPSQPAGRPTKGGGSSRGSGAPPASKAYALLALTSALVLLILAVACGNLGSLLLARSVARDREIRIRVAVGAGTVRLIRQFFTESLLLAFLGSAAGIVVGQVVLRGLMAATGAPTWLDMTPDWRVGVFAIGIAFAAAILFGLAPALQAARQRQRSAMTRQLLIGAQVAASCVLLIVAGLLVRALDRLMSAHPGFDYQQVISINPGLDTHGYSPDRAIAYLNTLESRLRSLGGIESVALALTPPLGRKKTIITANVDGRLADIHVNRIEPDFFRTMGIPLVRGRNFVRGEPRVAIVSESLGRSLWPGEEPLGKQFDSRTVVGVAGSARQVALQDPDAVEAYFPIEAGDLPSMAVLVRASGRPEDVVLSVASIARALDPDVFPEVQLLKTSFRNKLRETELSALAVSLLGLSALLLACVGIVGLVAFSVAQRTKEIGIRMALGATGSHVLSVVLRQLSPPVAAGLVVGIGAAAALSQLLRRELYGISNLDPLAYMAAIGVFVIVVALAALWPARRALRVDPLQALRCD
jgi:predicted permease